MNFLIIEKKLHWNANAEQNRYRLAEKSELKIFSGIYLNTSVFSPGFNNIGKFEMEKL